MEPTLGGFERPFHVVGGGFPAPRHPVNTTHVSYLRWKEQVGVDGIRLRDRPQGSGGPALRRWAPRGGRVREFKTPTRALFSGPLASTGVLTHSEIADAQ